MNRSPDFDRLAEEIFPEDFCRAVGAQKTSSGWRCPNPDGHTNSDKDPSFDSWRKEGRTWAKCHTDECPIDGGTPVQVASQIWGLDQQAAAERLAREAGLTQLLDSGEKPLTPEAVYTYRDLDGDPLFEVVRFPEKDFRQRSPDPDGDGWRWSTSGVEKTLYRLPEVAEAVDRGETVYVVEGEKDVERLRDEEGVIATTAPGGAGNWRGEFAEHLQGATVKIVRDRDAAGHKHARQVGWSLKTEAGTVQILQPAVEGEGADVSDHLDAGHNLDELLPVDDEWLNEGGAASPDVPSFEDVPPPPQPESSQKDQLVALAGDLELFNDDRDEPYARIEQDEHLETWRIGSGRFRVWLAHRFFQTEETAPSSSALNDAIQVIRGRALFDGERRELANRFTWHNGVLWYDLADDEWRAVRIDGDGWDLVPDPPPLFRRYSHQQPQVAPTPTDATDLPELLSPYINVEREGEALLLLSVWLVTALLAEVPRPILILFGPQGSAKTFVAKLLRRLIDPSETPMPRFPNNDAEMAQTLDHHAAPFFDNVSKLSQRQSDTLCRAVTGDGFTKRKLYTDNEDVLYSFKRVLLLNGINIPAQKPDLLDRSLLIRLNRIQEEHRQEEEELWNEFEQDRPLILGSMFKALSVAMAIRPSVDLGTLPRMADWTRWGYAVAEAIGLGGERFLEAYRSNQQAQNQEALASHPLGAAVTVFMEDRDQWSGTPSETLEQLEKVAEEESIDTSAKLWPGAANWLRRRLNEVEPNLREDGIEIGGTRGDDRCIRFGTVEREDPDGADGAVGADGNPEPSESSVDGRVDTTSEKDGTGEDAVGMASASDAQEQLGVDGTDGNDGNTEAALSREEANDRGDSSTPGHEGKETDSVVVNPDEGTTRSF